MSGNVTPSASSKNVKPGDQTGLYYIQFCDLPSNSTWREVKDWVSVASAVDHVEVFPTEHYGWLRVKGKGNFMEALRHMEIELFKERLLVVDGSNETETVTIPIKGHATRSGRRRNSAGGTRQRRRGSWPRRSRTRSYDRGQFDDIDIDEIVARFREDESMALTQFMMNMSLRHPPQMQYYALPVGFPICNTHTYNYYSNDYVEPEMELEPELEMDLDDAVYPEVVEFDAVQ